MDLWTSIDDPNTSIWLVLIEWISIDVDSLVLVGGVVAWERVRVVVVEVVAGCCVLLVNT